MATVACNFSTADVLKVVRHRQSFNMLTCKCASRHSGVQFFDISSTKNASDLMCFVHFDLKTCFSPQRRAIFRHLKYKKCFGADVFCTLLTSKCASRHSGVQLFYFSSDHLTPHPPLQRAYFSTDPTHEPLKKHSISRLLSHFWRRCIFFLLTFALLHLLSAHLTTLLCFSIVHIVGS